MIEHKTGYPSHSKTALLSRYNLQSGSLLQNLQYNNNKREPSRQNLQTSHNLRKDEDYEQNWQHQFLKQLQRQLNSGQSTEQYYPNFNLVQYRGDRLSRQIKGSPAQKNAAKYNRKQLQKYKAYAVRLKIPSFQQIGKPRIKEDRITQLASYKETASSAYLRHLQELFHPKLGDSLKQSLKQQLKNKNYQSINEQQILKRNIKSSQKDRNLHIRKRSIKHAQKKEELNNMDELQKNTESSPTKISIPVNRLKKVKKSSQRSSATPYLDSRNQQYKQRDDSQAKHKEIQSKYALALQKGARSPKQFPQKEEQQKIEYLQKGISFKRKEKQSPSYQASQIKQKRIALLNKHLKRPSSLQNKNHSETKDDQALVRQTPRNFLLHSIVVTKETKIKKIQNLEESKSIGKQQKRLKETKLSKIISFNSEDKYIRRLLLSQGWVLNPDTRSKYFHLKWVFKPLAQDYNHIREGQYINHIKNSHQLTSKNCLNKNLKAFFPQTTNLYKFYPQCFDISKPSQKQQFFEQYTKEFMMLLLRKIYYYVESNQFQLTQDIRQNYENYLQADGNYETDEKYMSFMRKKQFRNIDMEDYKSFNPKFTLHINLLMAALKYWRFLRKQQELQSEEGYHFLIYNQKQFENNLGYLERYSQMATPTFKDGSSQYFTKEYYSTPSLIAIERVVKEFVYFNRKLGQKWSVFGDKNIWIIKPCSASRGNGIYLQNNCKEILFNSKGIQSKIVQKYIERPLLFRNPRFPHIFNKKFDIRQWVLLRSIDPLEIYMFSHCYVRICSETYNIDNINNLKAHLTNYSFNKEYFKNPAESVLDYDTFKMLLKQEYNVDYEKQIKEKVKHIIIKSIKSAQQFLNDFDKRCFSLLGYDILLDQQFNPWLLEVNMSPACEERTQWLINYLKEMGHGMLKIVLPQEYLEFSENSTNSVIQKSINEIKQKKNVQDRVSLQLKRIKTEISHQILPFSGDNSSNLQLNLSENIEKDWQENKWQFQNKNEEDLIAFQQQITYDDFIKQHLQSQQQIFQNHDRDYQKQQAQMQNTFQKVQQSSFKNIREEQNVVPLLNFQNLPSQATEKYHLESQPNQSEYLQGQKNNQSQTNLKWEMICFQEYFYNKRKQIDGQLEVVGNRINSEAIKYNDILIDQFQQTKVYVQQSVYKLQAKIKQFLRRKQLKAQKIKEEEKQEIIKNYHSIQTSKQNSIQKEQYSSKQNQMEQQSCSFVLKEVKVENQAKSQQLVLYQPQNVNQQKNGQNIVNQDDQNEKLYKKCQQILSQEDSILQQNETKEQKIKKEQRQECFSSNKKLQQQEKSQKDHKLETMGLKLNFSQIKKVINGDKKARSRSVIIEGQLDSNSSIWHYSYLHTYRQGVIEKIQIDKNMNLKAKKSPKAKRIKNFYQNKPREKINSRVINAIADLSVSSIEQIAFKSKLIQNNQEGQENIHEQAIESNVKDDVQRVELNEEVVPIQNSDSL